MASKRESKGIELFAKGQVNPINSSTSTAKSEKDPKTQYTIKWSRKKCTCHPAGNFQRTK